MWLWVCEGVYVRVCVLCVCICMCMCVYVCLCLSNVAYLTLVGTDKIPLSGGVRGPQAW